MNAISKWTLALLTLLSGAAHAQQCTTLTYTGAPFVSLIPTGVDSSPPLITPLSGTVTLAEALPANAANYVTTPVSWQFVGGGAELNSAAWQSFIASYGGTMPVFTFSTDANGNITAWSFAVQWQQPYGGDTLHLTATSSNTGDSLVYDQFEVDAAPPNTQNFVLTGTSTTAGTWACQQPSLQAELDTANQMIEALEAELNAMHANNVYMAKLLGRQ
jgi:hypothetical protein